MTPEETAIAIDFLRFAANDAQNGIIVITKFEQKIDPSTQLTVGVVLEYEHDIPDAATNLQPTKENEDSA
jgi:hypothetical protein